MTATPLQEATAVVRLQDERGRMRHMTKQASPCCIALHPTTHDTANTREVPIALDKTREGGCNASCTHVAAYHTGGEGAAIAL